MSRSWPSRSIVCAAILVLGVGCVSSARAGYVAINIGTFGGDTFVQSINNSGQMAGFSYDTVVGQSRAFLYSNGTLTNLGATGGIRSWAWGINASGEVIGTISGNQPNAQATLWSGGTVSNLGSLGGPFAAATGINNAGQVVGTSTISINGPHHAFLYSGGVMNDLGTLGGTWSQGVGINNSGQVVGYSAIDPANQHAFLYSNGVMTDLGLLPGSVSASVANAINDLSQVVGYSYFSAIGSHQAFLWSNGSMTQLDQLPGSLGSVAYGINNAGQVVGGTQGGINHNGTNLAILWQNGAAIDLNTQLDSIAPGWTLIAATGINDFGQIAAYGVNSLGETNSFLLTPDTTSCVPEPAYEVILDVLDGQTQSQVSAISCPGPVTKIGNGTFVLTQVNTHTLGTNVLAGVLSASADNQLGLGSINLNGGTFAATSSFALSHQVSIGTNGGTFNVAPAVTLGLALPLSGGGTFHKSGAGSLALVGDADGGFAGSIFVDAGLLSLQGNGGAPIDVNAGMFAANVNVGQGAALSVNVAAALRISGLLDLGHRLINRIQILAAASFIRAR